MERTLGRKRTLEFKPLKRHTSQTQSNLPLQSWPRHLALLVLLLCHVTVSYYPRFHFKRPTPRDSGTGFALPICKAVVEGGLKTTASREKSSKGVGRVHSIREESRKMRIYRWLWETGAFSPSHRAGVE